MCRDMFNAKNVKINIFSAFLQKKNKFRKKWDSHSGIINYRLILIRN